MNLAKRIKESATSFTKIEMSKIPRTSSIKPVPRSRLQYGLLLCALFVILTDGLILVASPMPYLFGIINASIIRFEETLLYLPVVKNFDILDPFLADFSGLRQIHMIGPLPYATMVLAKLMYYVGGATLNGSVLAIHSLIILEFIAVFYLCGFIVKDQEQRLTSALLVVFGSDLITLAFSVNNIATTVAPAILIGAGTLTIAAISLQIYQGPSHWHLCCLVGSFSIAPIMFDILSRSLLGTPWVSDIIATRFFSPLIPFCFFFATLGALYAAEDALAVGKSHQTAIALTITGMVVNFYVYFGNWLILTPSIGLWMILRWRQLRREPAFVLSVLVGGCVLSAPFAWTIIASRRIPAVSDYLYRAGNFGIQTYHRFNYPPLSLLAANLLIIAIPTLILLDAQIRRQHRLRFCDWLPILTYSLSIIFAFANYCLGDVIPQAQLMFRYWIPLAVLTYYSAAGQLPKSNIFSGLLGPAAQFATSACIAGAIGIWVIGRWNTQNIYSGPAIDNLALTAAAIANVATPADVFVSDWQSLTLLAPSYGLRTLSPNPIMTIETHQGLINMYMDLNKLLGRSTDEFLEFVGDIDRRGLVHEPNQSAPRSITLMSQHRSIAYPMPPLWLQEHEAANRSLYETLEVRTAADRYSSLLICLRDGVPVKELAELLTFVGKFAAVQCWRRQNPVYQ